VCNINSFKDTVTHPSGARWRFYWNCNWGGAKGDTSPYERVVIHIDTQFRGVWQSPTTMYRSSADAANCATGVGYTNDHSGQTATGCIQLDTGDPIYPNDIDCIHCSLYPGGGYDLSIGKEINFAGCWRSGATSLCGGEDAGRVLTWGTADGLPPRPVDWYSGGTPNVAAPGGPGLPGETDGGGNLSQHRACDCAADPVQTDTGNFTETTTDIAVPGRGVPLSLSRSYNAQQAGTDSAFGYGWTNSYGISLYDDTTYGSGIKAIRQENGSIVRFQQQGTSWVAAPRVLATLVQNGDGTWTFTRKARERFVFDATGKLIKELDLNSYATTLAYDASGRLTTVTDPSSRTLTFGYGGNGKVSSLTDTANRTVQYAYDGAGNLSDVMDVGGGVTHFGYDSSHRLTTVRDPRLNTVTTNTYDAQDRVLTQKDALLRTTTFDYISIPGSTKITDPKATSESTPTAATGC
jgi:YD repeat-containing protein